MPAAVSSSLALVPEAAERSDVAFTRFALPFAYSLAAAGPATQTHCFRQLTDAELPRLKQRRLYLHTQTSKALFEQAAWFQLDWCPPPYTATLGQESFEVVVDKPIVVLFEFDAPEAPDAGVNVTQTGFLLVDARIQPHSDRPVALAGLLAFNEYFRYQKCPFDEHWAVFEQLIGGYQFIDGTTVSNRGPSSYLHRWNDLLACPIRTDDGDRRIVSNGALTQAQAWFEGDASSAGWVCNPDDRAFVWASAAVPEGAPTGITSGAWIHFLNVDKPDEIPESSGHYVVSDPSPFELEWAKPLTYTRWSHFGTLYGFSYHSGVLMASPQTTSRLPYFDHFRTHYFDLILMLLYLRATTFRFSDALGQISVTSRERHGEATGPVDRIRSQFALFTNLYRFPMISSQQQALEMFSFAQRGLDVDPLFKEVSEELHSFNEYLYARDQDRNTKATTLLSQVATVGLGVTLGLAPFQIGGDGGIWPASEVVVWCIVMTLALIGLKSVNPAIAGRRPWGGVVVAALFGTIGFGLGSILYHPTPTNTALPPIGVLLLLVALMTTVLWVLRNRKDAS